MNKTILQKQKERDKSIQRGWKEYYSVSAWKQLGIRLGYWDYFKQECQIEYAEKVIPAINKKWRERIEKIWKETTKKIENYREALIWCSGSEDFQVGGKARKGWKKICVSLLKDNLKKL